MKSSLTTQILQVSIACLTLFTTTSEGLTQSVSYVQGVALESSYSVPTLPFTVKAVYGDFHNVSPIWVQLWKQGGSVFTYALVWQVKVTPQVGDGTGEWVQIEESLQITVTDTYKLGLVNDAIPGPLLQQGDTKSGTVITSIQANHRSGSDVATMSFDVVGWNRRWIDIVRTLAPNLEIILSVDDVGGRGSDRLDLEIGHEVIYDDLTFPYHIPLYLCNTSDCIYIRSHLGRAELPVNDTTPSEGSTTVPTIHTPRVQESRQSDDEIPWHLYIWLAILSFVLLLIIVALILVCAVIKRKQRREGPYSHQIPTPAHIPTLSIRRISEGGINNNGFERISNSTGSETSATRFARYGGLAEYATVQNTTY